MMRLFLRTKDESTPSLDEVLEHRQLSDLPTVVPPTQLFIEINKKYNESFIESINVASYAYDQLRLKLGFHVDPIVWVSSVSHAP